MQPARASARSWIIRPTTCSGPASESSTAGKSLDMSVKRLYAPQKPRPARRGNHNQPVAGQLSAASSSPFDYEAALRACARGERSALQKLYEQESPRLLGVVQRIVRDATLAE